MGMAGAQNHVRFRHLGESDGLSNSNVNTIWQDEFGMIWIGTADGLNRYDGNDITVYRPASGNTGIYSNNIRKICGDRNGNIYIISKFALSHFDIRTEKFSLVRSAGIQTITCAGGKLFAATKDTVFVMDATHPLEKYYAVPEGGGEITCLLMTTSGHLYIGTDRGLIVIDSNRKVTRKIPGMHSLSIYEDSQKGIWIATRDKGAVCASVEGLFSLVDDGTAKSLNSNYVREINEDIYGNLWICTIDGINIYDKHSGTIRNSVDGNVDDMEYIPANCITKDRDNTFWIGCSGGVYLYNPEYDIYTFHEDLFSDPKTLTITSIQEDRKRGVLYFGTENTGIVRYGCPSGKSERLSTEQGLSSDRIGALYYSPEEDVLYAGTQFGMLDRIDCSSGDVTSYGQLRTDTDKYRIDNIREIYPYRNSLILGTRRGIVAFDRDTGKCRRISDSDLLNSRYVTEMYVDNSGTCWVSISEGLFRIDLSTGETRQYLSDGELGIYNIISIFQDSKGSLWMGSSGAGLMKYCPETDSFISIDSSNSDLPSNYIIAISESPAGYLLLSTSAGFVRYDPDDNESEGYDRIAGFPIANLSRNGIHSAGNGEIFVAGYKNLISFSEARLKQHSAPDMIYFTSLQVNSGDVKAGDGSSILRESLLYQKKIELKQRNHSVLAIGVSAARYMYSSNEFEYRLSGFDNRWTRSTTDNKIVYTNLEAGNYTLTVRMTDPYTGKVTAENSLALTVRAPFYATTLARVLYALALLGIICFIVLSYTSRVKLNASLKLEKMEKAQIEESSQAKLKFLSFVSHEIRTPVTLIQSQIDSLLSTRGIQPQIFEKISGINRNLQRIRKLINELIDFRSHQHPVEPQFSKEDIIETAEKVFLVFKEYAAQRSIGFEFRNRTDEHVDIWFDPDQIEKVLSNLLSNAFKNTPEGGKITVDIGREGDFVTITVSDTGRGIPTKYQKSIFSAFYQVPDNNPVAEGTGLGLFITQSIISAHRGTISCTSEEGKGASFTVKLPAGDSHIGEEMKKDFKSDDDRCIEAIMTTDGESIAEMKPEGSTGKPVILIVEDNDELREQLSSLFDPLYEVETAGDGLAALKKIEERMPDIILCDLMMPNMDGNELCIRVKRNFDTCHIPFIMLTAKIAEDVIVDTLKNGADDFIAKPFNTRILISKCNNLINSRIRLQKKFRQSLDNRTEMLATNALDQEFIDKAVAVIEKNMTDPKFGISVLTSELAICRTRLFDKIHGITGQTPNNFINTVRLKKSVELITGNPAMTISEISFLTGFSNPSYFIKTFKAAYGMTPAVFKASLGKKSPKNKE